MSNANTTTRRAYRRTDDHTPGTPKIKLRSKLPRYQHFQRREPVARDAARDHWQRCCRRSHCRGRAGSQVKTLAIGDRVAPTIDTENITGRETARSWLAADEDGVLADYVVYDERVLGKLPTYLDWVQASIIPCAGVTAWSALKGAEIGQSVLIQGTGGVAMFALKLAKAAGLKVILSSSSDEKLKKVCEHFPEPPILTVNYAKNQNWHEDVPRHTNGVGVDIVVEVGGPGTLLKSMKCTRRGGIVSQVGYLDRKKFDDALEILPMLIDRRIILRYVSSLGLLVLADFGDRGINGGSKTDMDDLSTARTATRIKFDDIIDSTWAFDKADDALQYLWEGKQVGKVVIKI
ncbi:Zinc-type alcohol dehydrogenase-like protein [Lachnellula willkommii]|uniref:Zinc-type alcohol dehydrogenase-like protein n=1 Tax=Lachnellula willkommii TaxID=215461 RepID=A0A559M3V5_9HELO|nr:Zinc-type alcohol dehydrogenase-like protein [Lachnellula willkommii]